VASVTFDNVQKSFGDVIVIRDFDLAVKDKEFVVFVGPSGCGKSTALRMLAGLEEVTEGEIRIGDRVVNDVPPKDRDIAMVFQSYALYPHMTVYDNMAFGLKLRKTPKDEIDRRVKEAAASLGLDPLLDRKPKALSGGQRQRVAVGRAIVRNPAVFLMDEPLSNLDAKLRVTARAFISKLHKDLQTTFIYVTHDQVEAMTMGDRIAVLKPLAGGTVQTTSLQQCASPRELYSEPNNIFVAGFIGSPSMNFFDATLVKEDGNIWIDTGDFRVQAPPDRTKAYTPYVGKGVTFGIRPEHIYAPNYAPPITTKSKIRGTIEVVELLGHELHIYVNSGANTFVATIDIRVQAHVDDQIDLVMDSDNMHLFDKETELRII
jgi:multiple sugar transport system ATP-binding protein